MRLLISVLLAAVCLQAQQILLLTDESGSWPAIFGSVGMSVNQASEMPPAAAREQVRTGAVGIVEGGSATAEAFGVKATAKRVIVHSATDFRAPKLDIVW